MSASHVGLSVPEINDPISWCTSVLGFGAEIYGHGFNRWQEAKQLRIMTVDPDRQYRIVYVEDPWGSIIELCSHPYVTMWESNGN